MTKGGWLTRFVLVVAMVAAFTMLVVAPVRYSAEELKSTILQERSISPFLLGDEYADRAFERFLTWRAAVLGDGSTTSQAPETVDASAKLGQSDYGASMTMLMTLSLYRVAQLAELLPFVFPFVVVFLIDGLIVRTVRAREFIPHSPGVYGLSLFLLVVVLCFALVALCIPTPVHPALFSLAPVAAAFLLGRAAANFHKHG